MTNTNTTSYLFLTDLSQAMRMAASREENGYYTTFATHTLEDGTEGFMISWMPTSTSATIAATKLAAAIKSFTEVSA